MLKELLNRVLELKRPDLLSTDTDGQYIYSDRDQQYRKVTVPTFQRQVSNIESFAAYLLKEQERENLSHLDGLNTTVTFSENRASCQLNDKVSKEDLIAYDRENSPQWKYLIDKLTRKLTHAELLRVFQGLRPSFDQDYQEFMRSYRKVSFDEKLTINSQPVFEEGKAGVSMGIEFTRAGGGTNKTALPATLNLKVQFARDSKRFYLVELEIDSCISSNKEKPGLEFSLLWPDKDNVVAQAVADEIADFKGLVSERLPELLVVVNY